MKLDENTTSRSCWDVTTMPHTMRAMNNKYYYRGVKRCCSPSDKLTHHRGMSGTRGVLDGQTPRMALGPASGVRVRQHLCEGGWCDKQNHMTFCKQFPHCIQNKSMFGLSFRVVVPRCPQFDTFCRLVVRDGFYHLPVRQSVGNSVI